MGTVLAQLEPIVAPAVDWAGLLPVLLPAAGALVLLMVRSLVPSRLLPVGLDALWTFAVVAAGFVAVVVLWQRDGEVTAFGDQLVMDGLALSLADAVACETEQFGACFDTEDASIGVASFLEKGPGKATFTGR